MTRSASLLVAALAAAGCTPPGKPAPVPNGGLPTPDMNLDSLYAANCAGCHGADGRFGPAPPLNDPLFLRIVPDAALLKAVQDGRPPTPMPAFDHAKGGSLNSAQVGVLASGLKIKWGQPGGPPDPPPYAASPGGDATKGAAVFARACAGCHGPDGTGGTSGDRPGGAINSPAFLALSSDQVLRRYVITGRPDLGMPNFAEKTGRPADFQPLTAQDVTDLTALLASWRKPAK